MNHKSKTTEFSAHFSISRMGRYLHNQLTEQEVKEVELHLMHCERCSEGILQYIREEESDNQKIYQNQLKGKLKSKEAIKKSKLSTTQVKVLRAGAAMGLLFVFSFFAFNTVMHKKTAVEDPSKAEIRMKKDTNKKHPNSTLPKEQRTNENPEPTSDIDTEESSPALAMQKQPAATSIYPREKSTSAGKQPIASATNTVHKNTEASVSKKVAVTQMEQEEKLQNAENTSETRQNSEVDAHQISKVKETQPQEEEKEDTGNSTVVQPLPKIERLDIKKEEEKPDIKMEEPSLPVPKEVNLLQQE